MLGKVKTFGESQKAKIGNVTEIGHKQVRNWSQMRQSIFESSVYYLKLLYRVHFKLLYVASRRNFTIFPSFTFYVAHPIYNEVAFVVSCLLKYYFTPN